MSPASSNGQLIEAIIIKQASILGMSVAVRRARNVAGLTIDDAGKVTGLNGSEQSIMEQLVQQYKALSGAIGVDFCRQAGAEFAKSHAGFTLPEAIR